MAQNVSVKQYLIGKGHDPSKIGWDNVTKTAKIDGVDFYKPPTIINGSSYDSQQNLDMAYKGYNDKQALIAQQNKAQEDALYNAGQAEKQKQLTDALLKKFTDAKVTTTEDPYNQMIAQIMQQMNNPQAVDPYSAPQFAAAEQQSRLAANRGIRANQEATGAAGFGRSTRNTEGAQRIQNDADQQLLTQVVPQIQSQLQAQKQQELNNMMNLLSPLQTQQQNSITNARNENLDIQGIIELLQGQQDSAYAKSPDNPLVKGQILNNQISQLELDALPAEIKAKAEDIVRKAKQGDIDLKTAEYEYKELTDPNSVTNKKNRLALEAERLGNIELQKRINQIGKVQPKSPQEARLNEIALEKAEIELKQLKNPSDLTAEEYDKNLKPILDEDGNTTNKQQLEDQIILSGLSDYEQYRLYIKHGIPWDDPIPTK